MLSAWPECAYALAVAVALLVIPGLIVRLAGWEPRSLIHYLLIPAISLAILAVASNLAPVVGLRWSLIPVAGVAIVAAGVAFLLRRGIPSGPRRTSRRSYVAAAVGLGIAAVLIAIQFAYAFGRPDAISQTFDNIVHLNSVREALNAGNSSAMQIGSTSDIPFYPNGWHSLATLVAATSGASLPVAVNATNIAIGAVLWPASALSLGAAVFRDRPAALLSTAALSTGFGAFPLLLVFYGVLYPNLTGYAALSAGLAAVIVVFRTRTPRTAVREAILLLVITAGIGLSHPNAFLALYAMAGALVIAALVRRALHRPARRRWLGALAAAFGVGAVGAMIWHLSTTPYSMSRWSPWQTAAQAFGEALLGAPRQYPVTITIAALLLIGVAALVRRPRHVLIAVPFLVATTFFLFVSGTAVANPLRELLTRPWYNDSYRLAALLPIAAIPVAVVGILATMRVARRVFSKASAGVRFTAAVFAGLALFSVAVGPNMIKTLHDARLTYESTPDARLLSNDERALIERLPETTPADAVIAGSPRTGASLAFALANRKVMEFHIFGNRTEDELYIDEHLSDIETDPEVCVAVRDTGISYVLDFGDTGIGTADDAKDHEGVQNLQPSSHLVLVDSQGPGARLFRIEGCS